MSGDEHDQRLMPYRLERLEGLIAANALMLRNRISMMSERLVEEIAHPQINSGENLMHATTGETIHETSIVGLLNRQRRAFVIVSRATGDPSVGAGLSDLVEPLEEAIDGSHYAASLWNRRASCASSSGADQRVVFSPIRFGAGMFPA